MNWPLTTGWSLLEIMGINLVLSGDNAVLVAMAIRRLAPQHRRPALVLGVGGATVLQILATLVVSWLFRIPLLLCVGGLLLSGVALRLLREETRDATEARPPESLGHAAWMIMSANCLMSLDNVLAVASIGQGQPRLIVAGLGISIVLTLLGSVGIAALLDQYPFLVTLGASILAWSGGRMMATDAVIHQAVWGEFGADLTEGPLWFLLPMAMTTFVFLAARRRKHRVPLTKISNKEQTNVTWQ